MPSANVFRKITDSKERSSIFEHLVSAKREIIAKSVDTDSDLCRLEPQQMIKGKLFCAMKNSTGKDVDGTMILQFSTGTEKYFAQAQVQKELESWAINLDFELYLLQRREDFRLKFPRSTTAKLVVTKWKDKAFKAQWNLLDMSAGGCRLQVPPSAHPLASGDLLEGTLIIQGRVDIPIKAEVKHIAPSPEDPLLQYVGLQFLQISDFSKDRLVAIVMDLYREMFSSLKHRS